MVAYAPNTTEPFPWPRLKNRHVKAMANTVSSRRNASESSTDDGNFWTLQLDVLRGCIGSNDRVNDPLQQLVEEEEWVEERIRDARVSRHDCGSRNKQSLWRRRKHEEGEIDRKETFITFLLPSFQLNPPCEAFVILTSQFQSRLVSTWMNSSMPNLETILSRDASPALACDCELAARIPETNARNETHNGQTLHFSYFSGFSNSIPSTHFFVAYKFHIPAPWRIQVIC